MPHWHVPVHGYVPSVSELADEKKKLCHIPTREYDPSDQFFDDMMDITYPPFRYFPQFNDREITKKMKKEHDRMYKKLMECLPYACGQLEKTSAKEDNGFMVDLDVKHYKPEEVTLKVEGRVLEVSGKHHNKTENGFETSEFQRKYTISDDVDATAITSIINEDGVLHIEAPKMLPVSADSIESTKDNFKYCLDVQGFKPEEISIQVKGRDLVVRGETKTEDRDEHGLSFHHKQFTKKVSLPDDVDPSHLSSCFTKNSKLNIEAPRSLSQAPLKLEIKMDE
ncbi:uncharacterized protein LOC101235243 isoform X1 [Hydra vulgaris]|uniref:uncharacterized protein LOC101235243 isoform X1 n=1 Tax=Hydra vulgaris TaxID=6087 RepID=UPI001F5EB5F4|nr:uncharacterized protein LOC101235243 [Hydra vulgaris]